MYSSRAKTQKFSPDWRRKSSKNEDLSMIYQNKDQNTNISTPEKYTNNAEKRSKSKLDLAKLKIHGKGKMNNSHQHIKPK
jgi:hypothetical protein